MVSYIVLIVATIGGWALLGEALSTFAIAGFLTVFAGFTVIGSESIDVRKALPIAVLDDGASIESGHSQGAKSSKLN